MTVYKVVLTGGPCGGKTSSLEHIKKALSAKGFSVYTVPEVPTLLIMGGCSYPGLDGGDKLYHFETAILQAQIQLEASFEMIARSTTDPSILLMDRALLDIAAYLPDAQWKDIIGRNGWTEDQFAARYDLILHLVTAAEGAEQFYTTANNAARTETAAEAIALDHKLAAATAEVEALVGAVAGAGASADTVAANTPSSRP